jgi:hypothetical protein
MITIKAETRLALRNENRSNIMGWNYKITLRGDCSEAKQV